MIILVDGNEWVPDYKESNAVAIEMWYDRHRRNWVIYPVDKDGNQIKEAIYGFGKAEALKLKKELEDEYGI